MTSQQAKEILLLYRPGTADAADPDVAQAIDAARSDPELGRWFERHCAAQSAILAGLRQIPVPEGLREQIVSEVRAQVRSSRRNRFSLVATVCAVVVLLIGLAVFLMPPADSETRSTFLSRMVKIALRGYNMDRETNDLNEIRAYLAQSNGPSDYVLPPRLNAVPATGAKLLSFNGQPVSMICFVKNKTTPLWLFVINRAALPDPPPDSTPIFQQINKLMTASWTRDGKTYVLAGEGTEAALRLYF